MSTKLEQMLEQINNRREWHEFLEREGTTSSNPPPLPAWRDLEQVIHIAQAAHDLIFAHDKTECYDALQAALEELEEKQS